MARYPIGIRNTVVARRLASLWEGNKRALTREIF